MEPTLHVGDLLIVQGGIKPEEINVGPKTGDIIVFRRPGRPDEFVVHRAVGVVIRGGKYYFRTKGDNNPVPDSWLVPEDYIIGKVIWSIPLLGYVKIYLGTPIGMAAIIILIGALVIIEALPSFNEENKKGTPESGR